MLRVDLGGIGQNGQWVTVNSDASGYRPQSDIVADITASANELSQYFAPQSVDEMRCVHTLEHLPFDEIVPTLAYWKTMLKPGGRLLIVVPDMGQIAHQYSNGKITYEVFAALAHGDTPGYRSTRNAGELHRWGWDAYTLHCDLKAAGFTGFRLDVDEWPSYWLFDYPAYAYTGLVGKWQVANLRMIGVAP